MKRIGVFLLFISISHYAFANVMCEDATDYYAVYEINTYNCESGKYLPANTDGCVACPQYHYCSGGTFTFNTDEDQGIVISCPSGYFVPANTDGCVACTHGHYCSGGTFTFNTDEDQGIAISCPSGYFVPANTDGCVACPAGYTCAGGTFTFNENEYQGAEINSIGTSTMNNVCAVNFPTDMYAVYEPDTVSLTWDNGNGTTTSTTCTYDGLINLPPDPTRPGYRFKGWKLVTQE